jgi:hypothetical protein
MFNVISYIELRLLGIIHVSEHQMLVRTFIDATFEVLQGSLLKQKSVEIFHALNMVKDCLKEY